MRVCHVLIIKGPHLVVFALRGKLNYIFLHRGFADKRSSHCRWVCVILPWKFLANDYVDEEEVLETGHTFGITLFAEDWPHVYAVG